ncbi:MAG: alpha/beta fold hydrolase [Dehalococcoidia bacterium]|nr:alpha/beta fold hydrolase [Dehalococcoidia bacterium]
MRSGCRIAYWDWGNAGAPPLVLVHGGRDHARSWDRIAEALCNEYHVVAPDLRGHGDSDWTPGGNYGLPDNALDIVRVVETVGSPARVLAHSYGGRSACWPRGRTRSTSRRSRRWKERIR